MTYSRLLAAEIEGFKNTYSGLGFRFYEPEAPLFANVDTTLIREAVGNLLSNAASYAQENSDIEVQILNDEGFGVITVDNKGPTVSENTEPLFGPFSSTRARLSSAHQGLGLFLVRLVVGHYGGRASLCNLPDASGVRAAMWIPLVNQPSIADPTVTTSALRFYTGKFRADLLDGFSDRLDMNDNCVGLHRNVCRTH